MSLNWLWFTFNFLLFSSLFFFRL